MKKFLILIGILILLLAILCSFTACGNVNENSNVSFEEKTTTSTKVNSNSNSSDSENIEDNIETNAVVQFDNDTMILFVTNNNNVTIDELELKVMFYKNSSVIDLDEDWHDMVLPGATVISKIDLPDEYEDYEIEVNTELDVNPRYENHSKEVAITNNKGEDCEIVSIKNNSDVTIEEVEFAVIFYNGDEIVDIVIENIFDLESGDTTTEKCLMYDYYDRAEVYLNKAHTFGL